MVKELDEVLPPSPRAVADTVVNTVGDALIKVGGILKQPGAFLEDTGRRIQALTRS